MGGLMIGLVNVLEEIVVKEVYIQIEKLRPEMQPKVKVAEVTAYTLNRLPPLFSTSMSGWKYQYDHALNELHPQISQIVKRGIKTALFGDPLHDVTPLPNHLFMNRAGALHQLSQILGRKYLRWRDVPVLIKEIVHKCSCSTKINGSQDETVIQSDEETKVQHTSHLSYRQRTLLSGSKRFMEKQLAQKQLAEKQLAEKLENELALNKDSVCVADDDQFMGITWANEIKARDAISMEHRAIESYTLQAKFGLINVLEHLVLLAIDKIAKPETSMQLNRSEAAAYALNRLPPMYATSVRGFRYLKQKAIAELSRDLIGSVRNGILKVHQLSNTDLTPIYAYQFEQEYEQSIVLVGKFLGRDDISLENIVPLVQELVTRN